MGPNSDSDGDLDGDLVADSIENTQVFIGNIAAPILFASSSQINTVVPFGVTGTTTQVQVLYQAQSTASATVQVQPASPAIFSLSGTGGGQGAILNTTAVSIPKSIQPRSARWYRSLPQARA